jgi:hypothetical protein
LADLYAAFPTEDGPEAITRIRNLASHPTKQNLQKLHNYARGVRFEAWQLTLWYVEMVILKLLGHNGFYRNRLILQDGVDNIMKMPQ